MASETQRAQILQIALPAALRDGDDVVGIPQSLASHPLQPPPLQQPLPVSPAGALQVEVRGAAVHSAQGANAAIALKDLFPEIARIGAKTPLMDTPLGAKRETPRRDFEVAPSAQRPAGGSLPQNGPVGMTARHGARSTQRFLNIFRINCFDDRC